MKKTNKPLFITLEGVEGVGKSTSRDFIEKYLTEKNIPLCVTREPGGTEIAEKIREVLLAQYEETMTAETELLLMFAARAQHIASVIKPALAENKWVLSDRFTDASFAYQGGGRGLPSSRIEIIEQWVQGDLQPDITILLDAPVELALARAQARSEPDRIEKEKRDFFERIRAAYLKRAQQHPQRFHLVDASQSVEQVQEALREILEKHVSQR